MKATLLMVMRVKKRKKKQNHKNQRKKYALLIPCAIEYELIGVAKVTKWTFFLSSFSQNTNKTKLAIRPTTSFVLFPLLNLLKCGGKCYFIL